MSNILFLHPTTPRTSTINPLYQVHDGHDFLRVLHQLVVQLPGRRVAAHVLAVDRQIEHARGANPDQRPRVQAQTLFGVVYLARNVRMGVL